MQYLHGIATVSGKCCCSNLVNVAGDDILADDESCSAFYVVPVGATKEEDWLIFDFPVKTQQNAHIPYLLNLDYTLYMCGVRCSLHVVTPPVCEGWFSSRTEILEFAPHLAIIFTADASDVLRSRKRKTVSWRKIYMAHVIMTVWSWWWWWIEMTMKTTRNLPCNTLHLHKEVPFKGLHLCKEWSMWSKQSIAILLRGSMSTWIGSLHPCKFSGWRRQGAR